MLVEHVRIALRIEARCTQLRFRLAQLRAQDVDFGLGLCEIRLAREVLLRQSFGSRMIRSASRKSAAMAPVAASAASALERESARSFSASTLSSRATICPASTTFPSSTNTSTTLPVISAAIVAFRRATT